MERRPGVTLLELLVVIPIIAVLVSQLLPAIQRVRSAALRTQSMNNLRRINLAVQNFAANHDGKLPNYDGYKAGPNPHRPVFLAILPHIDQGVLYRTILESSKVGPTNFFIPQYVSPADPTIQDADKQHGPASYGANVWAFDRGATLAATFADGTSNTFAFTEHYHRCGPQQMQFMYRWVGLLGGAGRPATFADPDHGDPKPVTKGNPPVTGPSFVTFPSVPTFQVAPTQQTCLQIVPQTPHREGMLAALMDSSVRTLSPSISPQIYWAAITPAGGEVLGDW